MRNITAILVTIGALGCATSSPLDEVVTARVESYGGYEVYGGRPTRTTSADRIPCELDTRLGTHFFLTVPSNEPGRFSVVTTWTRTLLDGDRSAQPERLGREVRRFEHPFEHRTGTFLILTLNEPSDLFPARYEQVVSSGSGRVLFRHLFTVPECSPSR
jgi:hypothetical protein